jgi:hypothetical protein
MGAWPARVAVAGAAIALGWSAAMWLRRREEFAQLAPGLVAALLVFATAGLGYWRGRADAQVYGGGAAQGDADVDRFGGWIGQTTSEGVRYFAFEHAAGTAIAQKIQAMFERRFIALLVSVDNRGGKTAVELDVSDARLEPASVGNGAVLPRAAVLDSARGSRDVAYQLHGGRYVVKPGERLSDGLVFVDPARVLDRVTGLTLTANGKPLTIPGRFYTAAEKQAVRRHERF